MDPVNKTNYLDPNVDYWDEGTKTIDISTDPEIIHLKSDKTGCIFFNTWNLTSAKTITARLNSINGSTLVTSSSSQYHQIAVPIQSDETIYFRLEGTGTVTLSYRAIILIW